MNSPEFWRGVLLIALIIETWCAILSEIYDRRVLQKHSEWIREGNRLIRRDYYYGNDISEDRL